MVRALADPEEPADYNSRVAKQAEEAAAAADGSGKKVAAKDLLQRLLCLVRLSRAPPGTAAAAPHAGSVLGGFCA